MTSCLLIQGYDVATLAEFDTIRGNNSILSFKSVQEAVREYPGKYPGIERLIAKAQRDKPSRKVTIFLLSTGLYERNNAVGSGTKPVYRYIGGEPAMQQTPIQVLDVIDEINHIRGFGTFISFFAISGTVNKNPRLYPRIQEMIESAPKSQPARRLTDFLRQHPGYYIRWNGSSPNPVWKYVGGKQ